MREGDHRNEKLWGYAARLGRDDNSFDDLIGGTTFSNGERLRLSPQGYYYYGPFGLLWEYVNVAQDVARDIDGVTRSDDLNHDAWQLAWISTEGNWPNIDAVCR